MSDTQTQTPVTSQAAFHAVLVVEGVRTSDHREFAPNSLSWRTLPLPLMWQQQLDGSHKGAVVVGKIMRIERQGAELHGWGTFDLGSANGKEAQRLVAEQIMRGISIDAELLQIDKEQLIVEDMSADPVLYVLEARIGAATIVSFPAFPESVITLDGTEIPAATSDGRGESLPQPALQASDRVTPTLAAISSKPWDGSASRFDDSQWKYASAGNRGGISATKTDYFLAHHEPTGEVSRAGVQAASARFNQLSAPVAAKSRAREHLLDHYRYDLKEKPPTVLTAMALVAHAEEQGPPADWFTDPDLKGVTPLTVARSGRIYGHAASWGSCHTGYRECMLAPRSRTNYAHFLIGATFASGCDCETGIPTGPVVLNTNHADAFATPDSARTHYDNSGQAVADVAVGEDAFGIWVAGALRPGVTDAQLRALRGGALSGDWRYLGGNMELISLLVVNTPGFPIPRVNAGIEGHVQVSLVAAGIPEDEITPIEDNNNSGSDPADLIAELKREQETKDEPVTETESEPDPALDSTT